MSFAETYERKLSIVVSILLQGVAWSLVGLVPHFIPILIAWALWGFGYTFMSGAYEAWITDEVGSDEVGPVFVRGERFGYAGALVGLGLGVGVAAYDLSLSVVLGGCADRRRRPLGVGCHAGNGLPRPATRRRTPEGGEAPRDGARRCALRRRTPSFSYCRDHALRRGGQRGLRTAP